MLSPTAIISPYPQYISNFGARMYGTQSARDTRATQRGNAREQQEDVVEVLALELITVQGTQETGSSEVSHSRTGQGNGPQGRGTRRRLCQSRHTLKPWPRLIEVNNAEVKKKAKDGAVDMMKGGQCKSADGSSCPSVDQENHRDPGEYDSRQGLLGGTAASYQGYSGSRI